MNLIIVKPFRSTILDRARNWAALSAAHAAHGGVLSYDQAISALNAAAVAGGYQCNARGFVLRRLQRGHVKAA